MVQSEDLHRLPMDRTLSLERKTGESHHFLGILIGAPLGFVIGGRLGKPSQAEMRYSDGMAEMRILVGAFLGTISGALIGSAFTGANWTEVPLPTGSGSECAIPSVRRPRAGG